MTTYIVLGIIFVLVVFAVFIYIKNYKKGTCHSCHNCPMGQQCKKVNTKTNDGEKQGD
jgi:hypothetical protein